MFSDRDTEARKGLDRRRSHTGKSVNRLPLSVRCVSDVRASNVVGLILSRALLWRYNVLRDTREENSGPAKELKFYYIFWLLHRSVNILSLI